MTDSQLIELIKNGKEQKALTKLYRYQSRVISLIKSRGGNKEDGEDVFQDALIVVCKKAKETDFQLTSSLDTYLYSVSYYIWKNRAEKEAKWINTDSNSMNILDYAELEEVAIQEAKIKSVEMAMQNLGNPCLKLLQYFYYKSLSLKDITTRLGYKTTNVAKTQKYKCIERIRKAITL